MTWDTFSAFPALSGQQGKPREWANHAPPEVLAALDGLEL